MWRRNGFYQKLLLEARRLISLQTNDCTFVNTYTALCLPTPANKPLLSRSAARAYVLYFYKNGSNECKRRETAKRRKGKH